jgi:hypothetical protein
LFSGSVDLVVQASLDPRGIWILVPVDIGDRTFELVLDTGSPLSAISDATFSHLQQSGLVAAVGSNAYSLQSVSIQGQPLPDLHVRLSRRASRLGIDGILGLTFFGQFSDIHIQVPTLRLTLTRA